nr:D-allose transporter substrate-binding protein [uncultured Caproiciproducens sp.]
MKKRILSAILAITMIATLFVGCSQTPAASSAPAGGASQPAATSATGDAQYAIVLKTLSGDFWVKMKEGIEAKAKELNIKVDIYAAQSEDDTEGQLKIVENCLNKNYKAIGVAPLSPVSLIPAIVKANQKGIYVMNIDEKIDLDALKKAGGSVISFATTDNVAVGGKGADYIISKIPDGGKVAIIEGKAGNVSGESRKQGATKAFAANSKFKVVGSLPADWDRQKALDVATSFIQQNPDLKAIYCCNDTMALGALQAVINANQLGKIIVVGTDGTTEALASIKSKQLSATIAQDSAAIGVTALNEMIKAVKDQPKIDPNVAPPTIPIESKIVAE